VTLNHTVVQPKRDSMPEPMPPRVRWAVIGAIGLALAGTLYLVSVRGEALLLDLKALTGLRHRLRTSSHLTANTRRIGKMLPRRRGLGVEISPQGKRSCCASPGS
jgi:hypothetical protein